jgi:hypothetical protein
MKKEQPWWSSPEMKKKTWKTVNGAWICDRVYHGIENEESYLVVVVEFAGTPRLGWKSLSESLLEP